jgi:hypothetical protein
VEALVGEVRSLREENAEYRRVIELQAAALGRVEDRLASLEDAMKALPPGREEEGGRGPGVWSRLWAKVTRRGDG